MSEFGFLTFASDARYVRLASIAAESLWRAWKLPLTVVIPDSYTGPMWGVAETWRVNYVRQPFNWLGTQSRFETEWQAIHATPYEFTIKIDSDMFFFKDWKLPIPELKMLADKGIHLLSARPYTYRNEPMVSRHCRVAFDENNLPDVYSAFFFFDKKQQSWDFFARARQIFIDWEVERLRLINPLTRPVEASTDVVYAMALADLNIDALACDLLKFVHMKSELNFTPMYGQSVAEDWIRTLNYFMDKDKNLYIENYKQTLPFHYYIKEIADIYGN